MMRRHLYDNEIIQLFVGELSLKKIMEMASHTTNCFYCVSRLNAFRIISMKLAQIIEEIEKNYKDAEEETKECPAEELIEEFVFGQITRISTLRYLGIHIMNCIWCQDKFFKYIMKKANEIAPMMKYRINSMIEIKENKLN